MVMKAWMKVDWYFKCPPVSMRATDDWPGPGICSKSLPIRLSCWILEFPDTVSWAGFALGRSTLTMEEVSPVMISCLCRKMPIRARPRPSSSFRFRSTETRVDFPLPELP